MVFTLSSFSWCIICLSFYISSFWKSYILCFRFEKSKYLVFWNYYLLLLNENSIYGLCFSFRTNEFMRSYNCKFIISVSIFNRMALWRTLKRFFVFHFLFPFLLYAFLLFHIFNLHCLSSNNPLRNSTNHKIAFFPFIISKDFYGKILILCLYLLQIHFGFSSFSHPDNALEQGEEAECAALKTDTKPPTPHLCDLPVSISDAPAFCESLPGFLIFLTPYFQTVVSIAAQVVARQVGGALTLPGEGGEAECAALKTDTKPPTPHLCDLPVSIPDVPAFCESLPGFLKYLTP